MQNYLASTLDIQWMPHFIAIQWTAYFSITVNSPPKNFNFHWNFTTNHFFSFQVKDRNSAKVRWSICPSPAVDRLVKRKANGMPERSARTPTRCRCKWGCRPQWPLVFGRCGYVIGIQSFLRWCYRIGSTDILIHSMYYIANWPLFLSLFSPGID